MRIIQPVWRMVVRVAYDSRHASTLRSTVLTLRCLPFQLQRSYRIHQWRWNHMNRMEARKGAPVSFRTCLAVSHTQRSTFMAVMHRLHHWLRMALHLLKLTALVTPLAITSPLVLALRRMLPVFESIWWDYALWAARHTSPALMKFLQWACTRRDIFPREFCDRFEQFHEKAPTHTWKRTEKTLREAFGDNWEELLELEREPIGSGCIAQVYRGKIRSSGDKVAVKVIHPDVKRLIDMDLILMRAVVNVMELFPSLRSLNAMDSIEEFACIMRRQLNLRDEAMNLKRFSQNFEHQKALRFPKPYLELTTPNVLVESLEEGIHFNDLFSDKHSTLGVPERKKIARVILDSYLRMVFLHNFAHGDLHPGNLLVESKPSNSTANNDVNVVMIDAGIVTTLEPEDMSNFVELFHAVATGNGYRAGELIIERNRKLNPSMQPGVSNIGTAKDGVPRRDTEAFCHGIENIVSKALKWNLKLEKVHAGTLLRDVMELCCKHQVPLEGKYASILVSIGVLEAVGRKVDPEVDILSVALPIILKAQLKYVFNRG